MANKYSAIPFLLLILFSCTREQEVSSIDPANWNDRSIDLPAGDSLASGTTYLPVYSDIYSETEHKKHDLTVTVSIRNVNRSDSIYIERADYYDTAGNLIRSYFDKTIFLAPLETVEIIIDQTDREGGSGANFIFDWKMKEGTEPLFEAVMISTYGEQGLSFSTRGVRTN